MAQQARERQAVTIAPRYQKPAIFAGTDVAWRSLCECYPNAETAEVLLAVTEYCAVRRLDPYKKPVHVVPMYNSRLRRKVQVVMQGINEIEITASRTGQWAGMDEPSYGPLIAKTFKGTFENDDGSTTPVEVHLEFPEWCAVTVYRLVGGGARKFTEKLWWTECYGRVGFRSEVPNERWTKAPRQMLHKCVKAAVLRAAFPEEGLGYAAEEMEDQNTDAGGVTIDGTIDHGDPGLTDRDRRIGETPPSQPPGGATDPLEEPNGSKWLRNFLALIAAARTRPEVFDLRDHPRVVDTLAAKTTPTLIKGQIEDAFTAAFKRIEAAAEDPGPPEDSAGHDWPDRMAELIAEVETMDLVALNGLATSAAWRKRVRDATEIPPDEDRLADAIAARRAALQGRS